MHPWKNKNGARVQGTCLEEPCFKPLEAYWFEHGKLQLNFQILQQSSTNLCKDLANSLQVACVARMNLQVAPYMLLAYTSSISSLHIEQKLIELGCMTWNHLQITGKICPIFISHGFHRRSAHYTIQAAGENGEDRLLLQLGAAVAAVPSVKNVKSQRHMAQKKLVRNQLTGDPFHDYDQN